MKINDAKAVIFAPRSALLSEADLRSRDRLAKRLSSTIRRKERGHDVISTESIDVHRPTDFLSRVQRVAQASPIVGFYFGPVVEFRDRYFLVTATSAKNSGKSQVDLLNFVATVPYLTCFLVEQLLPNSHALLVVTKDSHDKLVCERVCSDSGSMIDLLLESLRYIPQISVDNLIDLWKSRHKLRSCRTETSHMLPITFESNVDGSGVLRSLDHNLLSPNSGSREDGINELQYYRANLDSSAEANFLNFYFAACDPDVNVRCAADRLQSAAKKSRPRVSVHLPSSGLPHFLRRYCTVPAGSFVMGSQKQSDAHSLPEEQPQHSLYLPDFRIARVPVTTRDWTLYKKSTTPGFPEDISIDRNLPKTYITWYEALEYCNWLTEVAKQQKLIRPDEEITLPSEAEWEKAARGINGRVYPWGNEFIRTCVNYRDNGPPHPSEVGIHNHECASPYGVADMAGNVWEWTRSLWGRNGASPEFAYPYVAEDGRENLDAPSDVRRVVRGGAWYYFDYCLRCSTRNLMYPYVPHSAGGFRTVIRQRS